MTSAATTAIAGHEQRPQGRGHRAARPVRRRPVNSKEGAEDDSRPTHRDERQRRRPEREDEVRDDRRTGLRAWVDRFDADERAQRAVRGATAGPGP